MSMEMLDISLTISMNVKCQKSFLQQSLNLAGHDSELALAAG